MSPTTKRFLQRWLITTGAVLVAAHVVPGIHYTGLLTLFVASLLLGIFNALLRPIMLFVSLPLVILTFGLFALVINALLLYLVAWIVQPFVVDSFFAAFWGSLVISITSLLANWIFGTSGAKVELHHVRPNDPRRSRGPNDDGGGPVIDV